MFAGRCDLMAQAILATHTDGIIIGTVKRHSQRVRPGLLLAYKIDVYILSNFLKQNGPRF